MSHKPPLKLRFFFVATVQKASFNHFKSDLSNFSYKHNGIYIKKFLTHLLNILQRLQSCVWFFSF